jgi:hypothetical protein
MLRAVKERLNDAFPLIVAAALPLAGLALAAARLSQDERPEAGRLLVAALLGSLIWAIVLSA